MATEFWNKTKVTSSNEKTHWSLKNRRIFSSNMNNESPSIEIWYQGQWVEDNKHGQGSMIYNDGSLYKGSWKDNKKHGPGKQYDAQGKMMLAYFKKGKVFKPIKQFEPNLIEILINNKRNQSSEAPFDLSSSFSNTKSLKLIKDNSCSRIKLRNLDTSKLLV